MKPATDKHQGQSQRSRSQQERIHFSGWEIAIDLRPSVRFAFGGGIQINGVPSRITSLVHHHDYKLHFASEISILIWNNFSCDLCQQCTKQNKMLSYRRETAMQGALISAKSGKLEVGDNIYGHYRSIFNHCDIIGCRAIEFGEKMQNKVYYAVQGHSRSSRSVPIESQ